MRIDRDEIWQKRLDDYELLQAGIERVKPAMDYWKRHYGAIPCCIMNTIEDFCS